LFFNFPSKIHKILLFPNCSPRSLLVQPLGHRSIAREALLKHLLALFFQIGLHILFFEFAVTLGNKSVETSQVMILSGLLGLLVTGLKLLFAEDLLLGLLLVVLLYRVLNSEGRAETGSKYEAECD